MLSSDHHTDQHTDDSCTGGRTDLHDNDLFVNILVRQTEEAHRNIQHAREQHGVEVFFRRRIAAVIQSMRVPEVIVLISADSYRTLTAKEMYVHVNTIKYRIRKISEILCLDPVDDDNALSLMLSFKILEYRKAFPQEEPLERLWEE